MASTTGFTVPFARNANGVLVAPEDANKKDRYACPGCGSPVDLHAGERKRRHFHHRSGSLCSSESVSHLTAKALIALRINSWVAGRDAGAPSPLVVRACAANGCSVHVKQSLPKKVVRAAEEVRVGSGHVVDVGLFGPGDVVIAAIEVLHSHAVDAKKSGDLPMLWIEVDAAETCAAHGRLLVPVTDRFLPFYCEVHRASRKARAKIERVAPLRRNAVVAAFGFRLEDFPGFEIERIVVCPNGHDAAVFTWQGSSPPSPRPPLVVARERKHDTLFSGVDGKLRRTLPFRRRYVSICGACGAELDDDARA